jgi:hypothetical protein
MPHLQDKSVNQTKHQHGVCIQLPLLFHSADGGTISIRNVSELPVPQNGIFEKTVLMQERGNLILKRIQYILHQFNIHN